MLAKEAELVIVDKASVVRIVALVLTLVAYFGVNVPEGIEEYIVGAVMLVITIYSAWKNNYLAKKGKAQKEVLEKHNLK